MSSKYSVNDVTSTNFLHLLEGTVCKERDKTFATWYNSKGKPTDEYTFQQVWEEAGIIALDIRTHMMLEKGDRAILCYDFGLRFFAAFLGCLRAGVVAVPVFPPFSKSMPKALSKMSKIVKDSGAKVILVDDAVNLLRLNPLSKSRRLWPQDIIYQVHPKRSKSPVSNQSLGALDDIMQGNPISSNDLAFLQYTSGSTGDPKGVMVTFGALNNNAQAIIKSIQQEFSSCGKTKNIVGFSWLPQYHDMGLIFTIIAPFLGGWNCNMISPVDFIKNPLLWINLMSSLNVNWSVAPNFAYRLVARKFIERTRHSASRKSVKEPIANLDLSSLKYLGNAAEPIQVDTIDLFQKTFGKYGLPSNSYVSGYGLAESVVYVCGLPEFKLSSFKPANGKPNVAVGHRKLFPKGQIAKIIDPVTFQELSDKAVGELWLAGPSIAAGYFGKPEITKQQFHAKISNSEHTFLKTGDLAFFEDDYLYICGREKDLIIVNGVNYYPQDIEYIVQNSSSAVRQGCVAAFSSNDTHADGNLEVVFEVRKEFEKLSADVISTVCMKIRNEAGIMPTRVAAIKERTILKTTSGKIQRKANRHSLHSNKFVIIDEHNSVETQNNYKIDSTPQQQDERLRNYDAFDKIMVNYFGFDFDKSNTWDELGLSSMTSISLRDSISDSFAITLDPDSLDIHITPHALKAFVFENQGSCLNVDLPLLPQLNQEKISWFTSAVLQLIGSVFLLFIFSVAIVPTWYVGKWFSGMRAYTSSSQLFTSTTVVWFWFPVVVPVWMISLSIITITLKWFVIWKYREGQVAIPSLMYVRWWMVDRAVALWEFWVGRFILDTPLINLFYFLLGANLHRNVSIEAFIREFDLVEARRGTSLQFQVRPRKFGIWNEKNDPSLRFRSVKIGSDCIVKGMVSLGANISDKVFIEKLAVLPEGAKVLEKERVSGNPAFTVFNESCLSPSKSDCQMQDSRKESTFLLGVLKMIWLVFELYLFFAIIFLGKYLWISSIPRFRYSDLLEWALILLWFGFSSLGASLVLKWTLIGRRQRGMINTSVWTSFKDWAVDWHFQVASGLLISLTSHSRIWNIILMMHGMDIDLSSRLAGAGKFVPSKVDLIKVKKSFISVATFDTKNNKQFNHISIENSSIGLLAHLTAEDTELSITNTIVPPMTQATASITQDKQDHRMKDFITRELGIHEVMMTIGYIVLGGLLFCTFILPYELWMNVLGNPSSIWIAVPAIASCLAVHTFSWTLALAFFQTIALSCVNEHNSISHHCWKPFGEVMYSLYGTMAYGYQTYSFVNLFLGSPVFNFIMKCLGVNIEGQALMYPDRIYEHQLLSVADKTIIDGSQITGHYIVFGDLVVGPCKVAGVMHEGTYAANAYVNSDESECYRVFIGTYNKQKHTDTQHTVKTMK